MKLVDALQTKDAITENGMATNSTTLNSCVDLFFQIGALRNQEKQRKINAFAKAFADEPLTAMRILFWARDIRGGAGERGTFRDIITHLVANHTDAVRKNLNIFAEYGRWDDLLVLVGTKLEKEALDVVKEGLENDKTSKLTAKWLPRGNGKNREKKRWASALRSHLGLDPKSYRKMLASKSDTVEQRMCAKEFDSINYSHVPSKAMSDYMKAFSRNDGTRFQKYLDSLAKGEVKINTGAIYPYDVIKNLRHGNKEGANLQWDNLPNYLENSQERFLPIIDTSGSMFWPEAKISGDLYAGHVVQSLALYISERNLGAFKDAVISFNTTPSFTTLKGNLTERYNQLQRLDVGGGTNIEATFDLILNQAVKHNVPQSEMPTMIAILSDMEFNQANGSYWNRGHEWNPTAQEMIEQKYAAAGYKMPKVVYWNLAARNNNNPVQFDKQGTALVSGFSPSLLTSLLAGKDLTPYSMMMDIVASERYSLVRV